MNVQVEWLSPADNDGEAQFVQFVFEKVVRGTCMWIYCRPLDPDEPVMVYGLSASVCHKPGQLTIQYSTRMWADAQRDGRPAEHRWHPLFNAAKFGRHPLLECRAVTLSRRETR